jgi:hypothetical protein
MEGEEMSNGEISISFKADTSRFVVDFHKHKVRLSDIGTTISVGGKWFDLALSERPESCGKRVEDKLGQSIETVLLGEAVDLPVRVIIHLRRYMERPLIGLFGRIENDGTQAEQIGDFVLAKNALVDISGGNDEIGAHVARGIAHPLVVPLVEYEENDESSQSEARNPGRAKKFHADSNGMATLANKNSGHTFTMGFATGKKDHRPIVSVSYSPDTDEVLVDGTARFNGVTLSPQESIETDLLILQATDDPFSSLESYASLIAEMEPVRERKATTGWCSWYAIRLPISHEFTMANAQVVADRFRDLGMDIMLLDHGWQTGDICGDWDEDKKDYPKGLDGLAEDLDSLGLKLGIWIAPTEVAETSQFFQEHPDCVLRDKDGNPQPTGRWFWKPNPAQYQIDATYPDAYRYIVDTFRRLTDLGSVYYKIDFIAGCSGEHLYPVDPKAARGWTPLRKAMLAVREGAGEDAYVRYCQTPPLLSTGLADGVYATSDTLDAGASTWDVLRDVFRMSSAEYFLHGLYNHDGCDLSVRAHAGTEECRLRVMMFALSGSSIMFSDDLTKLPEERIVLMQQSMPPFPKAARPINLFTSPIPDVWHLRCKHSDIEWDLLALFNFDETQKAVTISWEDLGLPEDEKYIVREFWTEESLGTASGSATFIVPGLAGRLYSLWNSKDRPQYVGTNLHMSQGEAELVSISWDKEAKKLSGILRRAPGISGKAYYSIPPGWEIHRSSHPMLHQNGGLWAMELSFSDAELAWEIRFK